MEASPSQGPPSGQAMSTKGPKVQNDPSPNLGQDEGIGPATVAAVAGEEQAAGAKDVVAVLAKWPIQSNVLATERVRNDMCGLAGISCRTLVPTRCSHGSHASPGLRWTAPKSSPALVIESVG